MLIEAVGKPLRYRLSTGQEILFQPGVPVERPDKSALVLIKLAGEQVRVVTPPAPVPGDTVTWLRGGSPQAGKVDALHVDEQGTVWALQVRTNRGQRSIYGLPRCETQGLLMNIDQESPRSQPWMEPEDDQEFSIMYPCSHAIREGVYRWQGAPKRVGQWQCRRPHERTRQVLQSYFIFYNKEVLPWQTDISR